jgi:hypothetical protein
MPDEVMCVVSEPRKMRLVRTCEEGVMGHPPMSRKLVTPGTEWKGRAIGCCGGCAGIDVEALDLIVLVVNIVIE